MTVVRFFGTSHAITGFKADGHSEFAAHGEDIVCAAISVLTQTAVIGLEEVLRLDVRVEIKDGYLECLLPKNLPEQLWNDSQLILQVLYKGLTAIAQEYGDFLRIEEVDS